MTRCSHCHGTGHAYQRNPEPCLTTRTPRRMIPHGLGAEAALRTGSLTFAPYLFCGTCPRTGKDSWALASEHVRKRGEGAALVLPEGADPTEFRFPALPVFASGVSLVVFAFGMPLEQQRALGNTLIADGLDVVDVVGGIDGPLTFKAV